MNALSGSSSRLLRSLILTVAPWVALSAFADPTKTLGLYDVPIHQRADGYSDNETAAINANGMISGIAARFVSDPSGDGSDAWVYNPANNTTRTIGLFDSAHLDASGNPLNSPTLNGINDNGQVLGFTQRFNSSKTSIGQESWIYDNSTDTTKIIGLTDAGHTPTGGGYSINVGRGINNAGIVLGGAEEFTGPTDDGSDAWVYNSKTNAYRIIGPTDAAHTDPNGVHSNVGAFLNSNSQILGYSVKFDSSGNGVGEDCWLYNYATNTTKIVNPVTGANVSPSGARFSQPDAMNASGEVVGYAWYYTPSGGEAAQGDDAFLYNPATDSTTILPGLTGPQYLRYDGAHNSEAKLINDAGVIAGVTSRYSSSTNLYGSDAWVYNPSNNQRYTLSFSIGPDGFGKTDVDYLGNDGVVIGQYELYNNGSDEGTRLFRWTAASGFSDLGPFVDHTFTLQGWAALDTADVPEPSTVALLALTLMLSRRSRRLSV